MINSSARLALTTALLLTAWILGGLLHRANAGYSPASTFAAYSYDSSACSTIVDPITVVFTFGSGSYSDPKDHASQSDHGDWDDSGGGQYFSDDYGCSSEDGSAATGGASSDRWHMRWETAYTTVTEQSYAATPHWDDFILFSGHCVHSDGFTSGRAQVTSDFSGASDGHWYSTSNYWGNTASILKTECNPDEYASNDGYVNYIDLR